MAKCGTCGNETRSKWGHCSKIGPCNAARLKAMRQSKDDEIAALKTLLKGWVMR